MKRAAAVWVGALLASMASMASMVLPAPSAAHQFAPALLELEEVSATRAAVRWKQPVVRVQGSDLQPVLPPECEGVGEPTVTREGTGLSATWEIDCPGGLVGKTVGVDGIASSRADVLLRVALTDGASAHQVLTASEPAYTITDTVRRWSRGGVVTDYSVLGFEHILAGWDHLLFVLALVLLVGWGRSLVWTVTAFTLGHSVTLALAVLGVVSVPQGPIEAAIAASIFVLAVELTRSLAGHRTLTQRHPWAVAAGFGLLHGLGFAGALAEAGLPSGEIPLALFSFNLGIELGQLAFVAVVLLATALLGKIPITWPRAARAAPAYGIGVMAVYWFLERVVGIMGG